MTNKSRLKAFLVGVPEEFKELVTQAYLHEDYCKGNPSESMSLKIHRNGEFVELVDVGSLNELKGLLIGARNAIKDHKRGGSITLTTCDDGFENEPLSVVNIW